MTQVFLFNFLQGYYASISERGFPDYEDRGVSITLHDQMDVGYLNNKIVKADQCTPLSCYKKEITLSLTMTETIRSEYVFLVIVTTIGSNDEMYEVMSLESREDCRYEECQFGVKENYNNFSWFRYKCPKSAEYLIKATLLTNTSASGLCEVAIFEE